MSSVAQLLNGSKSNFFRRDINRNIGYIVEQLRRPDNSDYIKGYLKGELVSLIWTADRLKNSNARWTEAGEKSQVILAKIAERQARAAGGEA